MQNNQTKTEKISSKRIKDSYYKINHASGLSIYVYPKSGYNSSYAIFGTKFGSINNAFSKNGENVVKVPDGIAHFLEHKLFESEEQDAFLRFAKTGANANAYTSFDKTCYLFSCGEKIEENLEILLDFVTTPYFTKETVDKEQGIIAQEIKMYDDSPDWCVLFNTLGALYHKNPVKVDIAGTVDSIAKITPELLYSCYNTFYNLNNMVLCVCGNVTPEQVVSVADKMLKPSEPIEIEHFFEEEPAMVYKEYVEQKFPVSVELFNLGFKEIATKQPLTSKQIIETELLLAIIASSTSTLYKEMMDEKLINSTFSYELFEGPGFFSILFAGESRNPKAAAEKIKEYIRQIKKRGIEKEDFENTKKAVYGDAVSSFNSVDTISNWIVDFHFSEKEIFQYVDEIANVTYEDICRRFTEILNPENTSLSVILKN